MHVNIILCLILFPPTFFNQICSAYMAVFYLLNRHPFFPELFCCMLPEGKEDQSTYPSSIFWRISIMVQSLYFVVVLQYQIYFSLLRKTEQLLFCQIKNTNIPSLQSKIWLNSKLLLVSGYTVS